MSEIFSITPVSNQKESARRLFRLSFILFTVWIVMFFLFPSQEENGTKETEKPVTLDITDEDYALGQLVTFELKNNTEEEQKVNLILSAREEGEWNKLSLPKSEYILESNTKELVSFSEQNTEFFGEPQRFQTQIVDANTGDFLGELEFQVSDPGIFRSLWRAVFFKPIENLLILFLTFSGHYLWVAIILLTLLVKVILIVPSKKAILSQQKMQKLQPEIEKVKNKYKTDPQRQAQEMMGLWKKHKINPGAAIWPMLLQFPVLIALFFVVKDGLMPYNNFLLYPIPLLHDFDFTLINFDFLWLSLDQIDPYFILPVSIGVLQFFQMKMMAARNKKNKSSNAKKGDAPSQQESIMKMMNYILPVIIVVFSATLPAAVGLYWGTSTVFAIAQQALLHKDEPVNETGEKKNKKKSEKNVVEVKEVKSSGKKKRIKA